ARNRGVSADTFAAQQAEFWRNGLAASGQDGARIRKLREAADFAIYTPGSDAGLPVSVLKNFAAPAATQDREAFRDTVAGTAASLLGLAGIDADPVRSREHILLSTIFDNAWSRRQDLDLPAVIRQIQSPPFSKVG